MSGAKPGYYKLEIERVYLVDIQGTIEMGPKAEVYGSITITQGGKDYQYFSASKSKPVEVEEPFVALNEGKQTAPIPRNGNWKEERIRYTGGKDEPKWVLTAELYEKDDTDKDDLICKGSETLRPGGNRVTADSWACKGEGKLVVEWRIKYYSDALIGITTDLGKISLD
ncbi:hypothetical protein [Streptomyces vinaceus]|uniref:hypothetical protein n=1 Tax=Streptomyces vinaceus TaxID=1960 RepID=UPI003689464B